MNGQEKPKSLYEELMSTTVRQETPPPAKPSPAPVGLYDQLKAAMPEAPPQKKKSLLGDIENVVTAPSRYLRTILEAAPANPQESLNLGKMIENAGANARNFMGKAGMYTPQDFVKAFGKKSVMEGVAAGSTPGNIIKEKGPSFGKQALETVKECVTFAPELVAQFLNDPLKTIEERPLDLMVLIEGVGGPKLRAKFKYTVGQMAKGPISTAELSGIFKDIMADAPNWKVPPNVKAEIAKATPQVPPVAAPPAPTPAPTTAAPPVAQPPIRLFTPEDTAKVEKASAAVGEKTYQQYKDSGYSALSPARGEGYAPRKIPGLGVMMVDNAGKQITMTEFLAKKSGRNIKAAEDLAVALSGAAKPGAEATPPPTGPPTPTQELLGAVKGAKKLTPEQAAIYTKERGQRIGQFERTSGGLTGEAKARARRSAMVGPMQRVGWEPIKDRFTPEAIDGFYEMIQRDKRFSEIEKLTPESGLTKILNGELPIPSEIDAMTVVFGKDLADVLIAKRDTMTAGMRVLYELGNLPRSLMASYDLSAPLRQGIFMVSHPKLFGASFKEMPGFWTNPAKFEALQNEIIQRPTYLLMKKSGLGLTNITKVLKGREEVYASSWAERVPGVKGSERAYVGFLNKLRADTFDYLVKMADEKGMKPYEDVGVSRKIASLVNNATGRGSLKGAAERSALALNSLFFSPRLMASRLNLLNPLTYAKLPKYVRGWAIKTALADLGIATTVLGSMKLTGLADVNLDFSSPDFLKIKVGNTRIDVMGGFSQYYRVLAQSANFLYKNYVKGEKVDYNALERLGRFLQYKEAPTFTLGADILRGKNLMGEKFNVPKELLQRLVPMQAMDIWDVIKDDPARLPLVLPGIFGVGVQTYEEKPKKKTW